VEVNYTNYAHDILFALKSKLCTNQAKDIRKKCSEPQERRELGTRRRRVVPRLREEVYMHIMCVSMVCVCVRERETELPPLPCK
jgi:hypothetical protein